MVETDLPVLDIEEIVPESLDDSFVGSSDKSKELILLSTFSENEECIKEVDGDKCDDPVPSDDSPSSASRKGQPRSSSSTRNSKCRLISLAANMYT
jgi:hypothetical protein